MRKKERASYRVLIAVAVLLLLPFVTFADTNNEFKVDPFNFGLGSLATWARDAGKPGQKSDPKQYGLYIQKHTPTANFSAAGARITKITPMSTSSQSMLAFEIPGFPGEPTFGVANGYCGAGAPRFNVNSDASALVTCFLGCAHGDKTQDLVTGWREIKFVPPFTQYPGCEIGISGTISKISIVFDEGIDQGPGDVILDNIRVDGKVVGKPTGE